MRACSEQRFAGNRFDRTMSWPADNESFEQLRL